MEPKRGTTILGSLLLFFCMAATCYGIVLFSSLPRTLQVTASFKQGQGTKPLSLSLSLSLSKKKSLFCFSFPTSQEYGWYLPVSQVDRAWRKTVDNLAKDKACQFNIWTVGTVERDVPSGTYFVRAFGYDSDDVEVAYGQTTDAKNTTNMFDVQAITGRHASLNIASVCFSAFSVLSLLGFLIAEKRRAKLSERK
ncbi:hypothetical protein CIPAW_12G032000 [Carya illinoinensis]|uniref:High-affinity nitrate transporter n=1 Tax=Carya illinoinensis TaxID=32201 RepID=A0A8T1NWX0_CARIL|nr:hypothetical protein CIPAW_12G032000 [Carya illinoinensis]